MSPRRLLACVLAAASLAACAQAPVGPGVFSFGAFGDLPYFRFEEPAAEAIVREMGAQQLAFIVHIGDIKGGGTHCTDAVFEWNRRLFDASAHPLVYLPGDNEWTDCHRASNGGYDPIERLAKLRATFYPDGNSLGARRMPLRRQSDEPRFAQYRENVLWTHGNVVFAGLNIPGSNNNWGRNATMNAEWRARGEANRAWLARAFDQAAARDIHGLVVAIQANPLFELPATERARRGYNDFIAQLEEGVRRLAKPVLLIHGDSHVHRIDKPLIDPRTHRPFANFTRLETYGSPFLGWVKVTVAPKHSGLFHIEGQPYRVPDPAKSSP